MRDPSYDALWIAVGLLALLAAVLLLAPYVSNAVKESNLPIEGRVKFITAKDVVSYGTAGNPPCLEIHDYDCITSYEYSVNGKDGDTYRLDTEQFPVRFENNTDPKFSALRKGEVVVVSCNHISSDSRDNPKNNIMNPSGAWTLMISDRNLYFGCEISTLSDWLIRNPFARRE